VYHTQVVLPSSAVKSYTDDLEPVTKTDKVIKYGKYDLIQPWSLHELRAHYESGRPFRKVRCAHIRIETRTAN
jgi:hypothetical protein